MADITLEIGLDDKEISKDLKTVVSVSGKEGKRAGDNFDRNFTAGTSRAFRRTVGLALAAGAGIVAAFASRAAIRAASVQADAVNALNSALFQSGEFSEKASKDFQSFASAIQSTTRFGDEAVLQQIAYAKALGISSEETKDLISAATNLSSALGISLDSATRNLVKSYSGLAGELGELVPGLRNLTKEQLEAGGAVDLVAQKFSGFAERDVQTFSGRLQQLSNNFNGLQKSFGFLLINAPGVSKAIGVLSQGFVRLSGFVSENSERLGDLVRVGLVSLVQGSVLGLKGILALAEGFLFARNAFLQFSNRLQIAEINKQLEALPEQIDINGQRIQTTYEEVLQKRLATLTGESEAEKASYQERLESIGLFRDELIAVGQSVTEALSAGTGESKSIFAGAFDITEDVNKLEVDINRGVSATSKVAAQINAIQSALTAGISNSIQALGKSLVTGENFFKGFLGIVLNALGDLLIGFGTASIVTGGVAEAIRSAIVTLAGGQAIVAGVASIAAGGALKAFAGSLGASGAGGPTIASDTGTAGGGVVDQGQSAPLTDQDERRADQSVQLIVQGDILDSEDTGKRLLNLLNDNFKSNNGTFTGARFA